MLGALAVAFPADRDPDRQGGPRDPQRHLVRRPLYSRTIPESALPKLTAALVGERGPGSRSPEAEQSDPVHNQFALTLNGVPNVVFYRRVHPNSGFAPAYQIGIYSLADAIDRQESLRTKVLAFGMLFLLLALVSSFLLARGLAGPVQELAAATGEVQRGNLAVRVPVRGADELRRLATSFNAMARASR